MKNYNLSIVQKICLAGIFIVLVAIFQKIFAVNYLPIAPFVRFSFGGPALIIFSSVLLGPWFGMLIGAASDLLGFLIFDPKTITPYPMFQITLIYALLGFLSYFIFKWLSKLNSEKKALIIEFSVFGLIAIAVTLFMALANSVTLYGKLYELNLVSKIVVPICVFILLGLLALFIMIIRKHFKKKESEISVAKVSFGSFILEISVMLIFGSIMKTWGFASLGATPFVYIFISQLLVSFFNVPINTVLVSYLLLLSDRIIRGRKQWKN